MSGAVAPSARAALAAILSAGQRFGVTAVLLDDAQNGTARLHVVDGGIPSSAAPATLHTTLDAVQLFELSQAQAAVALDVLSDEQPTASPAGTADPAGFPEVVEFAEPEPAAKVQGGATSPTVPPPPPPTAGPPTAGPVTVRVLGQYQISAGGREVSGGLRRSAKELLIYYLLHPEGTSTDAAIDALWPEADTDRGPERFWTALGNLRTRLREATGDPDVSVITKVGERRYRLQDGLLTVDLWNFQAALRDAGHAAGEPEEADLLSGAAGSYSGDLADEMDYWWAQAAREDLHHAALGALLRLAELHTTAGRLPKAITCLRQAVALDPHAEETCRRLIRAHSAAGQVDEARRTYRQLVGRLADIDLEPDETTDNLIAELQLPPPRTPDP